MTIEYRHIEVSELRLQSSKGYLYFIDSLHPLRYIGSNKVYYHRHLASIKAGYWLTSNEHVHHIDGDKQNNKLDNLLVLEAGEHSRLHHIEAGHIIKSICPYCNNEFVPGNGAEQIYCSPICASASKIKNSISKEELELLLPVHTWTSLGKLLGYSGNGIKKRAIALGVDINIIGTLKPR